MKAWRRRRRRSRRGHAYYTVIGVDGDTDPLQVALDDIARCSDASRAVMGPQDAAAHWRLVLYALSSVRMRWPRGISFAEKISIGTVGLVKAARTYNPEIGAFSTYALPAIAQALIVGRSRAEGGPIGIPNGALAKSAGAARRRAARRALYGDYGIAPADDVVPARADADELAEEEERAHAIARVRAAVATLAPDRRSLVEGMMAGRTLRELGDERGITAEAARARLERIFRDMRDRLADLEPLLPRARAAIRMRFAADPGPDGERAHGSEG